MFVSAYPVTVQFSSHFLGEVSPMTEFSSLKEKKKKGTPQGQVNALNGDISESLTLIDYN